LLETGFDKKGRKNDGTLKMGKFDWGWNFVGNEIPGESAMQKPKQFNVRKPMVQLEKITR